MGCQKKEEVILVYTCVNALPGEIKKRAEALSLTVSFQGQGKCIGWREFCNYINPVIHVFTALTWSFTIVHQIVFAYL